MFALSLLVGVVGVTAASSQNFTENQRDRRSVIVGGAHFNQIDFRYPDWVVDPRPPCTSEGVFPHPRSPNCDWYYRCVARVGVPIYATFYFQCEPGTMFEDDLDQCVWPHSGYQCQGGPPQPSTPRPCVPDQNSCRNYAVCGGGPGSDSSQYMCRLENCDGTVREYCPRGQLKNMATGRCEDIPKPCADICDTLQSSCGRYEVCGGGSQILCSQEICRPSGVVKNLCSGGLLKDTATNRCVVKPERKPLQSSCKNYTGCGVGSQYLCRQEICMPGGFAKDYCTGGKLKNIATGVCVDTEKSCPENGCTASDCRAVKICSGSSSYFKTICEMEQCIRDGQDAGERRMCPPLNKVYDVDQKRCIIRPDENTCDRCDIQNGPSCCNKQGEAKNCRPYDLCTSSSETRTLCDCNGCGVDKLWDPKSQACVDKTLLCPSLKCVFRNTVCDCYNDKSLCTGCYMRGNNFIHVSQFCQNPASNAEFYHVEKESCLYERPGFIQKSSSGHCPRPSAFGVLGGVRGDSERFVEPALTCSLRDDVILRCWSDNKVDVE